MSQELRCQPPPLLPLPRAAISFLSADPTPPSFTDACTAAHGHQGEDMLPRSPVDAPAFEPRGNATAHHRAAALAAGDAGLRVVLGKSVTGAAAFTVTRAAPLAIHFPWLVRTSPLIVLLHKWMNTTHQ
jgi:hypothetical protein